METSSLATLAGMVRSRIRWWHWLLASVSVLCLALLVTAMSYRASGLRGYQRAVSARQALGRPGTLDGLLATLPPINQPTQEAWDRWSKACIAGWKEPAYDAKAWAAWIGGQGEVPASIVATCATGKPLMQPACDLLDAGEVLLSALGWASIDLQPGKRGFEQVSRLRIPNLLATRDLAEWLRHTAGLGDEPQPALRRLDGLQRSLSLKPGTLIDTMIAISSWAVLNPQLGPLARLSLHNPLESLITALEADANQRMARAAVHLIRTARTTGLPADQAAAGLSHLFTPAGDHLWIRYERLSDTRFRLVVDPASPIPNFDDPARMIGRTKNAGTPANTAPLIYENGIELSVWPLP